MFNRILVPLDGSELAERALKPALAIAQKAEGEVILLRVPVAKAMPILIPAEYSPIQPDQALEHYWDEAAGYLKTVQNSRVQSHLALGAQVIQGGVAEVIVDTAAKEAVDLIVMSSHGYSSITRWVMGSVAGKVLQNAPCPVLVVHSSANLRKALIPLDGSTLSESALTSGLEIASRLGSEVTLLRVVQLDESRLAYLERIELGLSERAREEALERAETYLHGLAAAHRQAGLNIQAVVKVGPAAHRILEFAEAHEMDLVVMCTHGRTGLRRRVYGSVTEKILRSARCSMLIIRPAVHGLN